MRAALLRKHDSLLTVEEVHVDAPRQGEVLVRIAASGICGSDVHVQHGTSNIRDHLPMVLGHEGAGVVAEVGPGVTELRRGDRVIIAMSAPCMQCENCMRGQMQSCVGNSQGKNGGPPGWIYGEMSDGTYRLSQKGETVYSMVGIGSLGEWAVVDRRKLVKVEQAGPFESFCLISCCVTTGVGAVFNCAQISPGASVLVFGCGGVGLSIVQAARIAGAGKIIAVDTNPAKLDLASDLGASHGILSPPNPEELEAEVRKIAPVGVDVAYDAVGGRPERLEELMALTVVGGLTLAVGVQSWTDKISIKAVDLLLHGRRLGGVRGGNGFPGRDFRRILDLYQTGRLRLDEMVGPIYELDDVNAAFEAASRADHGRVVVRMTARLH